MKNRVAALVTVPLVAVIACSAQAPGDSSGPSEEGVANSSSAVAPIHALGTLQFDPGQKRPALELPDWPQTASPTDAGAASANGIDFHGGPLMTAPVHLYYIWYGDWSKSTSVKILEDWGKGIGPSAYWGTDTSYVDGKKVPVSSAVTLAGETTDAYSQGKGLKDVWKVVTSAINAKKLPVDTNGVYFVLTSQDVSLSGFCTQFCGWHSYGAFSNTQHLKYSFVGAAAQCPGACSAQSVSPNGDVSADAMASVLTHELSETVTDPEMTGYSDASGWENGDKCAWNFGTTKVLKGAKYNATFNGRNWLLQQNWLNAKGGLCSMTK